MQTGLFYYLFLVIELTVAIFICGYTTSMFFSFFKGSPYVSTERSAFQAIFNNITFKPGQTFLELGSGDGRIVRQAVKKYQLKGIGVDINPSLTFLAKLRARLDKLQDIEFKTENILKTDLSTADIIYMFLFPELILKLKEHLLGQTKKPVIIISHGFAVPYLEPYLYRTTTGLYKTYFYLLKKH